MDKQDKTIVEELNEATEVMNKKYVNSKIKELKSAYKNKDRQRLYNLSDDFSEIDESLGDENKEALLKEWDNIDEDINKNGANNLNVAKLRNNEAKQSIVKHKDIIHEAAKASSYEDYKILDKKISKKRNVLLIIGSVVTIGALTLAANIMNKARTNKEKVNASSGVTTASTLSNTTSTGFSENIINETYDNNTNKTGYSVETIKIDYTSPTRETTSKDDLEDGSYVSPNATVSTIRETTPNDEVTVIVETTVPETEPVTYETSAIPTNVDGVIVDDNNDPVPTTSYIEPTGTDPLPIEPTHETLSWDELMEDSEYTEVKKGKVKVLSLR